jgi:hypothetical protein
MTGPLLRSAFRSLRVFWTGYKQIHERQQLRNRPWKEDLLHFGIDGRLHGHIPPPNDGRRNSSTSDGWCTGCARLTKKADLAGP